MTAEPGALEVVMVLFAIVAAIVVLLIAVTWMDEPDRRPKLGRRTPSPAEELKRQLIRGEITEERYWELEPIVRETPKRRLGR